MPVFEFTCLNCGKNLEVFFPSGSTPDVKMFEDIDLTAYGEKCECGNTKFKKLLSAHGKTAVNWHQWNEKRTAK